VIVTPTPGHLAAAGAGRHSPGAAGSPGPC
jgi:hypothetical protein